MNFYGNENDPLTKTLKDLQENSESSHIGNAGDFFTAVHERDVHTKPRNSKDEPVEFNAALLAIDDSETMLKYILLKNKIVSGDCLGLEESTNVDKIKGDTTVFLKWLQPKGLFELGTANLVPKKKAPSTTDTPHAGVIGTDVTDDTKPVPQKLKGKGSRKKNKKINL